MNPRAGCMRASRCFQTAARRLKVAGSMVFLQKAVRIWTSRISPNTPTLDARRSVVK
ncbi:MAG: hypothetical protein ACFN4W_09695 [Segatella oris]